MKQKPKITKEVASLLTYLRENANLSQAELAKRMGYRTPQYVSNWERGVSLPPLRGIQKLATILNVTPQKIYSEVKEAQIAKINAKFKKYGV